MAAAPKDLKSKFEAATVAAKSTKKRPDNATLDDAAAGADLCAGERGGCVDRLGSRDLGRLQRCVVG